MFDLLFGVPMRVWVLLALIVLLPIAVLLTALYTPAGRRFGLAARITSRTIAMMGFGFAVMALVATLAVLQTGLQEIRQRHLPAVVDLAAELSTGHSRRPDSVSFGRTLSLFRALQPDVGPTAIWGISCGAGCLGVAAEPAMREQADAWARGLIAHPPEAGALRIGILDGELHLVIGGILRDAAGAPEGHLAVAVRAGWVADRALRTALALVGLAYALLLVVGWATRGMLAATVASRVRDLASRLRGASTTEAVRTPSDASDELAILDHVVGTHIVTTVERLREADQRATEARALAARMEATATLAAGVAHDFSNLMSGVMANCEVLRLDVGQDTEAARTLDTILECARRGGDLAHQLVAFARGGRYRPMVINLNTLIRQTLRLEAHTLGPDVTVVEDLAWDLLRVDADPTQLTQVIGNLHRNAVEAIRDAHMVGGITVRTRNIPTDGERPAALANMPAGPFVEFSVRDTGPGMSEETRARIFEPFFTTKEGGRGMGLAATYGIIAHHGGQIEVHTALGRGTTFTVLLPATSAPAVSLEARRSAGLAVRSTTTVLVVDDEVPILSATRRLLERRGYRVLTAEGGAEALQLAQNAATPIDVAVLDLRMPGMSGAETFGPLVAAHPHIRVILGSGYDLDADARELLARGAVDFVRKPFRVDDLGAAIERAMGRSAQAT
jgi:signal transduction histidine kinase/ActR/RegA family two-component response regulator